MTGGKFVGTSGGAIEDSVGTQLWLLNVQFMNNAAVGSTSPRGEGGAIWLKNSRSVTIDGCNFAGNTAGLGRQKVAYHGTLFVNQAPANPPGNPVIVNLSGTTGTT
jgi:hypothetical protein